MEWFSALQGEIFRGGYIARGTKVLKKLPIRVIDFNDKGNKKLHDNIASIQKSLIELQHQIDLSAENIAIDEDNINEDKVKEVLKKVGLLEKIESFPKGIHTPLLKIVEDDGIILSGGENQKLMIARALYKDSAKILILDEPTAALDALAEEEIYKSFRELLKGRTAIFISHRLASTRFCDRIALLNRGKMEEEGTHKELLSNGGLYNHMYNTQASYYQEEASSEKW